MSNSEQSLESDPSRLWEAVAAEAILRHVPLDAADGTVLVAELGLGVFARSVLEAATNAKRVMLVDSDHDRLDAVRDALDDVVVPTFFAAESVSALSFAPDVFDAAFCVRGVVTAADVLNVMASLAERVRPGGWVGVAAFGDATLSTFDELLAESVMASGSERLTAAFTDHRNRRARAADLQNAASRCELEGVEAGAVRVPIRCAAEALMMSDLVSSDLAPMWRAVDEAVREPGSSYGQAVMRLRTYFDGAEVEDDLELRWVVGRVAEPPVLDVDDADVVEIEG